MSFAYTVCSLSYVPFAVALGRSVLEHHPGSRFYIGLVDKVKGRVELPVIEGIEFIAVDQIAIDGFNEMCKMYTIFELACACKPFYAKHLFDHYSSFDKLFYFDVDILLFAKLDELLNVLAEKNLILTPHITQPLEAKGRLFPNDEDFTRSGLYNAGFFGIKRSEESFRFLKWWSSRVRTKGSINSEKGYFADQSWLELAPLFFEGVHIERGPEYNAAYWNLHEREITNSGGKYFANGKPLVFYHFSGYRFDKPNDVSTHQNRVSFTTHPMLKRLFDQYRRVVTAERLNEFKALECAYASSKSERLITDIRVKIKKRISK